MEKIFCLETEWEKSVYDLKHDSQAKPLLEFLNSSNGVNFSFRQVATKTDFDYYIGHLKQASYKDFTIVYLCFHGSKEKISFADRGKYGDVGNYSILDFAKDNQGIFEGKIVHFGSCNTLKIKEEDIRDFKKMTRAIMVSGYEKSVDMTESFIFEAWLLNTLYNNSSIRATRLMNLAKKEMDYFVNKFRFVAY